MRVYNTELGLAREDAPGVLSILDVPFPDVGEVLRGPGLGAVAAAAVRQEVAVGAGLLAPVARPGKVLIVGLNYPSHGAEAKAAFAAMGRKDVQLPTEANVRISAGSAVTHPGSPIVRPALAPTQVDYEGELAVVIGSAATAVAESAAWGHVAGLTVINDVSARDIQMRALTGDPTASIGVAKGFDTFKPLGPCLVSADHFDAAVDLRITTTVNGEIRQDDRTSSLIHPIPELIAYISRYMTLEPGDVICTGTPAGAGMFSNRFLAAGDVVSIEIEGIGTLTNPVAG